MVLPDHIKKFLQKPNLGVLATISPSGRPQATPVWFMVDGDEILINTAKMRVKLRNIKINPRVALVVFDRDDIYQHVQIRGTVVGLDDKNGARDIDRLSLRYRGTPYKYQPGVTPADRVSVRIKPTGVTSGGIR
jgi:PPOX class probable F420-dependent enzyme